jgi:hypothetical protein
VRGDRGVWGEAWYPRGGVIAIFCLWTLCAKYKGGASKDHSFIYIYIYIYIYLFIARVSCKVLFLTQVCVPLVGRTRDGAVAFVAASVQQHEVSRKPTVLWGACDA